MARSSLLPLLALSLFGCGSETAALPDAGPDATADTDPDVALDTPSDVPAVSLTVERRGARVQGPILALTRIDRSLWLGTAPTQDPTSTTRVRGGLYRLDLDSGQVTVFEDQLPRHDYTDGLTGKGPAATSMVVAFAGAVLAVQPDALVRIGAGDAVTEVVVADEAGARLAPYAAAADVARKRLWVGTTQGLVALDDALKVVRRIDGPTLGGRNVTSVTVDPATGDVFAVAADDGKPAKLARLAGTTVTTLVAGEGAVPGGGFAEVAFSARHKKAYATVASWDAASGGVVGWDGTTVEVLANEGDLALAAKGKAEAFGAFGLTVDDSDDLLVIGGRQRPRPLMPLQGGGLAWISLGKTGVASRTGLTLSSGLPGTHVRAVAYDPVTRRTFTAAMEPCSDTKLASRGLVAVSFTTAGALRVERPILSGVRALARGTDATFAVLRDDPPELGCNGYTVQGGLVRLVEGGGGEVVDPRPVSGSDSYRTFRAGLTAVAVKGNATIAAAGFREELFQGDLVGGKIVNLAGTYGVSNWVNGLAFQGTDGLIVGGRATHDPTLPDEVADDRSPRGLLWIRGETAQHFVRTLTSPDAKEIAGLPTSEIAAVLPDGDGVIVACATERTHHTADGDRILPPVFVGKAGPRKGGLVRLGPDAKIEVLAGADVTPDPSALARGPDGTIYVLDLERGLLRRTASGFEVVSASPSKVIWHHLFVGRGGDRALASGNGVDVTLGSRVRSITDVGHAWYVLPRSETSLLVGTDEGLVRVGLGALASEAPKGTGTLPPFGAGTGK